MKKRRGTRMILRCFAQSESKWPHFKSFENVLAITQHRGATLISHDGVRDYTTYRPGLPGIGGYISQSIFDSHGRWHLGVSEFIDTIPPHAVPIARIDIKRIEKSWKDIRVPPASTASVLEVADAVGQVVDGFVSEFKRREHAQRAAYRTAYSN